MPRRPTRSAPTVIIPGWHGSEPGHWQCWLADQLRAAGREVQAPDLPDLDQPDLDSWLTALRAVLDGLPADGFDVVAHSLGAVLWLHHASRDAASRDAASRDPASRDAASRDAASRDPASRDPAAGRSRSPRPARVALVSPPSPQTSIADIAAFFPPPLDVGAVRRAADGTVLICGDADPYAPEGIALAYGRPLKMATTVISGGGHLNLESGYGAWPAMLEWCGRDHLAFPG